LKIENEKLKMKKFAKELEDKFEQFKEWYNDKEGVIVAFSGGIDSTLVLYVARIVLGREKAIGVISNSESLKRKDFELAKSFCKEHDIILEVIKTNEINDERYNQNPENRCFYCKENLYSDIEVIQDKYLGYIVLNGTNFDDFDDYRPGLQAAQNFKIYSPMADCKITKNDLRQIAKGYGLPLWNKPASPCLGSRIPYNQNITVEKLNQVEKAEDILNEYGFIDVRVRHYGDLAKVEVKADELDKLMSIKDEVVERITGLGFSRCEIDEEGLVSGKLNRVLGK
jgi:uncharacterized protein